MGKLEDHLLHELPPGYETRTCASCPVVFAALASSSRVQCAGCEDRKREKKRRRRGSWQPRLAGNALARQQKADEDDDARRAEAAPPAAPRRVSFVQGGLPGLGKR